MIPLEISPKNSINSAKSYQIENILTHWSVAQASSDDEKNWRSKILLESLIKKDSEKSNDSKIENLKYFNP